MSPKPRVLMVSHVWPVPGVSGQEKRVYYMLRALQLHYRVTFLTFADKKKRELYEPALQELCDEIIVLPSRYSRNLFTRVMFKVIGQLYSRLTGLKPSNFIIGLLELSNTRVKKAIKAEVYEAVIFEYWHAHHAVDQATFGHKPVILDMHNILWQTFKSQGLASGKRSEKALQEYKRYEEKVWHKFDYLIAINHEEASYVKGQMGKEKVWYLPMGIDMEQWPQTVDPGNEVPHIAWYGGLATAHNQRDALRVYREVMPAIWKEIPKAEFWIIGSNPPEHIIELGMKDFRVTVTGFLDDVASALGSVDLVLCPWEGTYGFRSRLIEVMATGTPVITTEDAASGMDLEDGKGILFENDLDKWSSITIDLLSSSEKLLKLRKQAREAAVTGYSLNTTYDLLPEMIKSISR